MRAKRILIAIGTVGVACGFAVPLVMVSASGAEHHTVRHAGVATPLSGASTQKALHVHLPGTKISLAGRQAMPASPAAVAAWAATSARPVTGRVSHRYAVRFKMADLVRESGATTSPIENVGVPSSTIVWAVAVTGKIDAPIGLRPMTADWSISVYAAQNGAWLGTVTGGGALPRYFTARVGK